MKASWINLSKMRRYAFLVRGINVGGRPQGSHGEEFCRELEELGMSHVLPI